MQKVMLKVSKMAQTNMRNAVHSRCVCSVAINKKRADILVVLQDVGDWHLDAVVGTLQTQLCGVL